MEEQIKMAKLNAEFSKKQNDLKARKQMVENLKHTRLRLALTDAIRSIEDKLSVIHDERDIEARRVVHEAFADLMELEEEGRRLNERLDDEKIKVMEEQHAAKFAREAAEAEEGGDQ